METQMSAMQADADAEREDTPAAPPARDERACPLWGFQEIMDGMRATGVPGEVAERLVIECGRERCLAQVRWHPLRPDPPTGTRAEMLQQAIEEDWPAPRGEGEAR